MKKTHLSPVVIITILLYFVCTNKSKAQSTSSFKTVTIRSQTWMASNLNVDTFRNGDRIPEAKTEEEWEEADKNKTPAWCYYENDPANGKLYGRLYNWYAVNDPRGLAPKGWHIPLSKEWTRLGKYYGGEDESGAAIKSKYGWAGYNGTNVSGFNGLPAGTRSSSGSFQYIKEYTYWWSVTEEKDYAYSFSCWAHNDHLGGYTHSKGDGYSVRCLKGEEAPGNYTNKPVIDIIRGQYSAGSYSGEYILEISIDETKKTNYCWIKERAFEQEYNPDLIINGVNLSSNYEWVDVSGSYTSGTYKVNPVDSSITFTWKKLYQEMLPMAYLRKREYDWVLVLPDSSIFVKDWDLIDGIWERSEARLQQIEHNNRKKAEEEKRLKEENEIKEKKRKEEEERVRKEKEEKERREQARRIEEKRRADSIYAENKRQQLIADAMNDKAYSIRDLDITGETYYETLEKTKDFLRQILKNDDWRFPTSEDLEKLTNRNGFKDDFRKQNNGQEINIEYLILNEKNEFEVLYIKELRDDYVQKFGYKAVEPGKKYTTFFVRNKKN